MSEHSFDFWIGEWEVRWTDADGVAQTGTNSVSRVGDTVRELFCAPEAGGPYIGASVSRWDDDADVWVQDYWDNRGYTAVFRGSSSSGQMVLEHTSDVVETAALTRLVWSDILDSSITWEYQRRTDAGAWETTWRILYSRRESKDPAEAS
jgi:hypothetical protein